MLRPHQQESCLVGRLVPSEVNGCERRRISAVKTVFLGILACVCVVVFARPTLVLPAQNQTFKFMGFTSGMTVDEVCVALGIPDGEITRFHEQTGAPYTVSTPEEKCGEFDVYAQAAQGLIDPTEYDPFIGFRFYYTPEAPPRLWKMTIHVAVESNEIARRAKLEAMKDLWGYCTLTEQQVVCRLRDNGLYNDVVNEVYEETLRVLPKVIRGDRGSTNE
ncbi:MAG TPA: hypothetical protein EYM33_09675 [Pseudomonadales bacterium]|nr:hypothetical protein [Pseudomonadales bacterium]